MTESRTSRDDRKIHIYIDISNILCGAIGVTNIQSTKLNIPCLIDIVSKRREVVRKVAVGSVPHDCNPRQRAVEEVPWKKEHFEVTFLQRVQSASASGRYSEQSVDDLLHAAIQEDLLKSFCTSRTLVLLTGDGNSNGGRTSFPKVIEDALLRDWHVEIWAWKKSISPNYFRMEQVYSPNFTVNQLDTFVDRLTYRSGENVPRPADTMGSSHSNRENHPVVKDTHKVSWQQQQQESMIRNGFRVKQQQGQQEQKQQQQQQQQQNHGQIKDRNRLSNQQQHHSIQRNQQKKGGETHLKQSQFNSCPISRKSTAPHIVDITADRVVTKGNPGRRLGSGQNIIDLCVIDDVEATRNTRLYHANRNGIISGHARVEVDDYDDMNQVMSNQWIEKREIHDLINKRPGPFTSIAVNNDNSNYSSDNGGGSSSSSSSSSSSLNKITNNNNNRNDGNNNNSSSSGSSGSSFSSISGKRGSVYSSRQNISHNDGKCEKMTVSPLKSDHGDLQHTLQSAPQLMRKVVADDITDLRDDVISSSYAVEERSSGRNGHGHGSIKTRRNPDSGLVLPSAALLNDACSDYFNTSLKEGVQIQKGSSSVSGSGSGPSSVTKNVNQSSSKNAVKRKRDSLIDLTDDSPLTRKISPFSSTHDSVSTRPSTRTDPSQNSSDNSRLLQDGTGSRVSNVGSVGNDNSDSRDIAQSMSGRLLQNDWSKISNTQHICGLLVKRPSSFHPSGPFTSHSQSQSMRQG